MKISVITPSYNQANFLKKTIESVISQKGDFEIEHIIMDGGSTDGSVEVIKNYESRIKNEEFDGLNKGITFIWKSENDNGQSDAINKGLRIATGDIVAYLNSDDIYLKDCFQNVAQSFENNSEMQWLTGYCQIIDEKGNQIQSAIMKYKNFFLNRYSYKKLLILNFVSQPCTFWRKKLIQSIGLFNEELHYTMDYDYWLRIGEKNGPIIIKDYLAGFRIHGGSKGGSQYIKQFDQDLETCKKYTNSRFLITLHKFHNFLIKMVYKAIK